MKKETCLVLFNRSIVSVKGQGFPQFALEIVYLLSGYFNGHRNLRNHLKEHSQKLIFHGTKEILTVNI